MASQLKLADHPPSMWAGLFDTRHYVDRYAGNLQLPGQPQPITAEELLEQLGAFLGQQVLGPAIMERLGGIQHRTLLVQLIETERDPLAAAFARVPWEIARPKLSAPSLMRQNLVVRAGIGGMPTFQADEVLEELRVLLVFAEAPGSRPLAMRQEREELLDLFYEKVLPKRRVEVDVLCHGVTEVWLREAVRERKGYHIIHWSGHGHHNHLELYGEDDKPAHLTGGDLVQLLVDAGGFIPRLVFLSACLSGTFVKVRDWATFEAAMAGRKSDGETKEFRTLEIPAEQPGYTGTALALLKAGVAQVVAMRYEVSDDYARELASQFYKHLLADPAAYPADSALALARSELLQKADCASGFKAVDHATPVLFGHAQPPLRPTERRSEQLKYCRPQPQPLLPGSQDLDPPKRFVGRGAELTNLANRWLPRNKPIVALVQGLAGLGKTTLVAEAIHLWHRRFDWVFAFQAKPVALLLDDLYHHLDVKLTLESTTYRQKCEGSPYARVYLEPGKPLSGLARHERMRNNLVEVFRDERILLILDNFETNLESLKRDNGYACQDPEWDCLLAQLAERLSETGSRVIITSRHRLAVLAAQDESIWVPLGPLPMGEAGLYIRSHPELRKLYYADNAGHALIIRLLEVSRGHPLILEYMGRLAHDREALSQALDQLQSKGWQVLSDVFVPMKSHAERGREWTYLEDVAIGSIDFLLQRLSPDARRLLWIATLANEPVVAESVISDVWSEKSWEDERPEVLLLLFMADQHPKVLCQNILTGMSPEELQRLKEALEKKGEDPSTLGMIDPLFKELHGTGLLMKEEKKRADLGLAPISIEVQGIMSALTDLMGGQAAYAFHELVRERIAVWMDRHSHEQAGRTQEQIWLAYGTCYGVIFHELHLYGKEGAMDQAEEAGRRALTYMARAHAYQQLSQIAGELVAYTRNPVLAHEIIAELHAIADQVPAGRIRRNVQVALAIATERAGQPNRALALYEQTAAEAKDLKDWDTVARIRHNWGNALRDIGQLDKAKAMYLQSTEAALKAGSLRVDVVAGELEALRIDVEQGKAEYVFPEIERMLNEVRGWWRRYDAGESVPDAPNLGFLGQVLIGALNIAEQANRALRRWQTCLELLDELEQTKRRFLGASRYELARTRFTQYGSLIELGRLDDAQRVVEDCLAIFREVGDLHGQAMALSALASVWIGRGDTEQALALERQALSLFNRLSDLVSRAKAHGNLASYLSKATSLYESARHQLACIAYLFATNCYEHLTSIMCNHVFHMRDAAQTGGGRYELPHLSALLSQSEFAALQQVLTDREVDLTQLQMAIDLFVEEAQRIGIKSGKLPSV